MDKCQKIGKLPPTGSREGGNEPQVPVWDGKGEGKENSTRSPEVSRSSCCPILPHKARRKIIIIMWLKRKKKKKKPDKIVAAISQFIETD